MTPIIWQKFAHNYYTVIYRIAGNFRGRKLSRISRISASSRKFSLRTSHAHATSIRSIVWIREIFTFVVSRKFSPSKLSRYTVGYAQKIIVLKALTHVVTIYRFAIVQSQMVHWADQTSMMVAECEWEFTSFKRWSEAKSCVNLYANIDIFYASDGSNSTGDACVVTGMTTDGAAQLNGKSLQHYFTTAYCLRV